MYHWDELLQQMKKKLKENQSLQMSEFWSPYETALDQGDKTYYELLLIFEATMIIVGNSAGVERSFKWLNDAKTAIRNRLLLQNANKLVYVRRNGWKNFTSIPFKEIVQHFNDLRNRFKVKFRPTVFKEPEFKDYDDDPDFYSIYNDDSLKEDMDESDVDLEHLFDNSSIGAKENDVKENFIPDCFVDLMPNLNENHDKKAKWLCAHEEGREDAVFTCHRCKSKLCRYCLKTVFNYTKSKISKLLKNTTLFKCPGCVIADIKNKKNKNSKKRKYRR